MKKRVKFKVFVLYEFENNILQKWQEKECLIYIMYIKKLWNRSL
jgi:predicted ester cyclase